MKVYHIGLTALVAGSLGLSACGGGNDNDSSSATTSMSSDTMSSSVSNSSSGNADGFMAVINDFAGYEDWDLVDYSTGRSNPDGLGEAHAAGNDAFTRKTFKNAVAMNSSGGEYDDGAILIKETFTYAMSDNGLEKTITGPTGLLAMVKRGGSFNTDNNGWEWFMLEPDLSSVIAQGETPNGAAGCNACHSIADTQMGGWDYTFPKPTEFIAETSLFADYTGWDMIEFDESPANLSGGAHIDDANQRRIFQKNIYANPTEAGAWGYPIGTAIVKDISTDNGIEQIVAMVKRGGEFDSDNGNWEYFMLDPADPTQIVMNGETEMRGALAGCIGCHEKAVDDAGIDYAFKHEHAPFNTNATGQYIATKASFSSYTDWQVTDYASGNSNPFLGSAHGASSDEIARQVFENGTSLAQMGDTYAQGAILVKEVFTTTDNQKDFSGIFAMVKRGGEFNPDNGGWEWLIMDGDRNILERGADIKQGGCNSCHSLGDADAGVDYTFNKPSEFIADISSFQGYENWTLLAETTGNSPANGSAHNTNATRKTYRKQASANPYVEAGEYPVGTTILKELRVGGDITTIYGMVKRGGGVNPNQAGWEFFTMNTALTQLNKQSATFCGGCHGKAGDTSEADPSFMGVDYTFEHELDPVTAPVEMEM